MQLVTASGVAPVTATLRAAVADVVRKQAELGVDVISDGEFGKESWFTYVMSRLDGYEVRPVPKPPIGFLGRDELRYPDFFQTSGMGSLGTPQRVLQIVRGRERRHRGVDPAGEPRSDLLDDPHIAVGIAKRTERPVTGALRVRAGLPRLDGERRAMPHVSHLDATADESGMRHLDVGDDQPALGRAWRGRCESQAERDRGPRPRRRELDDAEPVERRDVIVEPPTQSLVEPLGTVDVGHGDDLVLELHVDPASIRLAGDARYFGCAHRSRLSLLLPSSCS